jgi:hypothetical protein
MNCQDPKVMLEYLRGKASECKLRLLAKPFFASRLECDNE